MSTRIILRRAAGFIPAVTYRSLHVALVCATLSGCMQQMANQPSYRPLQASAFFNDGRSARPLVPGTVPRGEPGEVPYSDIAFYTGKVAKLSKEAEDVATALGPSLASLAEAIAGNPYVEEIPFEVSADELEKKILPRGQLNFNIFCAVCHDRAGTGNGMIHQRGFTKPPSFHSKRLREARVGYIFHVMTKGYGAMPDYAAQIPPRQRWEIVTYIRALQFSGHASRADVPPAELTKLEKAGQK